MSEKLPNPHITQSVKLLQMVEDDNPRIRFAKGDRLFKVPKWMRFADWFLAGLVYLTAGAGAIFFGACLWWFVELIIDLF